MSLIFWRSTSSSSKEALRSPSPSTSLSPSNRRHSRCANYSPPSAKLSCLQSETTDQCGTANSQKGKDVLELLIRHVGTHPTGSKVRCVTSSEAHCLKQIPQNAEQGVVRHYMRRSHFVSCVCPDHTPSPAPFTSLACRTQPWKALAALLAWSCAMLQF